jgi:hypothetical protein
MSNTMCSTSGTAVSLVIDRVLLAEEEEGDCMDSLFMKSIFSLKYTKSTTKSFSFFTSHQAHSA